MKLHQKIFGIGLLTAVIVPHLCKKCYSNISSNSDCGDLGRVFWQYGVHIALSGIWATA